MPPNSVTLSLSGRAYFTHCSQCHRFLMVNRLWWSPDFAGDSSGSMPVAKPICSDCAKSKRPRNTVR